MNKITFPLIPSSQGDNVANLQDGLLLLLEKNRALLVLISPSASSSESIDWPNVIKLLQKEREEKLYGKVTRWLIENLQKAENFELSGIVDEPTANKLNSLIEKLGAFDQTSPAERQLTGKVIIENGMPANRLKLRLYQRDFGKKTTLLVETQTGVDGTYVFTYSSSEKSLSLEVRAVSDSNEKIVLTKPLNNLKAIAVLNLTAPASLQPLADEYSRLSTDLLPHIGLMSALAEAQENAEQQDLTVLNRATGWDARLIALAATSEKLAADPEVALAQQTLYGLLRVGLPSDKLLLAQVEADVVEQALIKSRDAGIVELSDAEIDGFKQSFTTFSHAMRLNTPAPGSQSTYGQLLETSGLPQNVKNDFISVYLNHKGTSTQLWEAAKISGLSDAYINTFKLQGKFAYLAGK